MMKLNSKESPNRFPRLHEGANTDIRRLKS